MATIQGVYVALFGRPADPTGLAYFNSVTKNGADLKAIGNLAGQKEYTDRFTGMSNVAIINTIYQSLFNRDAEATGLNFFADALNKGSLTINNIATAILDGAQGDDKTIVTNKLTAAEAFTKAIDTPVEIAAYVGTNAAAAGRSFLATVTKDVSSIPNAAAVDKAVAGIATASSGGVTLSVTASQEVSPTASDSKQKSTAGDDTINVDKIVPATGPADNAVTSVAKIDGGFGNDTVTLKTEGANGANSSAAGNGADGKLATLNITPEYTSIEKLVVTAIGGKGGDKGNTDKNGGAGGKGDITVDVSKVNGLKELVNDSSTKGVDGAGTGTGTVGTGGSAAVAFNKIGDGVKLGLKGTITDTTSFSFDKAQTGTTTLALDKVKTAADVTIANGSSTVALTTANGSELTSLKDADVTTLNISGTGALTLGLNGATAKLATIDASALTGGKLTLDVSNGTVAVKITGTNAADDITLKNAAGLKDTIVYNKTEGSIYAAAESVTNFKVADDKLDLKALGLKNAGVQKLDNLTDGAAVFGTSSVAYYKNGNDTWVFADTNGDGKLNLATDFAVKLTGMGDTLTADNFSL